MPFTPLLSAWRPAWRPARRRFPCRWLPLSIGFVALCLLRLGMTVGAFRNSDDAGTLLAAADMARGNWRLHGWTMAPDSYISTDVLFQAVLVTLFGARPVLMPLLEALIWAGIGTVGTGLALRGQARRHWPGIVALALSMLGFNIFDHRPADTVLSSVASHGSSILLALLCFRLALGPDRTRRRLLLGLAATAGSMADPIFVVIGALPVLGSAALGLGEPNRRRSLLIELGLVGGGVVLGRLLLVVLHHAGGFESAHLTLTLSSAEALPAHLGFAAWALARILGADFFGLVVNHVVIGGAWIRLLRLPLLLLLAVASCEAGLALRAHAERWPSGVSTQGDRLEQMLFLSLLFSIGSTVITTAITDPSCMRFFLPAGVAGSILAARRFGRMALGSLYGLALMPVSLLFAVLTIPRGPVAAAIAPAETYALVDALKTHDLVHGYAGYWQGAMTTVLSDGRITSLTLARLPDGRLQPFDWFCDRALYRAASRSWRGRVFVVATDAPRNALEFTPATVTDTLGAPTGSLASGRFTILVYDVEGPALLQLLPPGG